MRKALQKITSFFYTRPFYCFQIEVSSRCNIRCTLCPREQKEKGVDLSWDLYQEIASFFPLTQWVHLQGWGEPLMHRGITAMLQLAKEHSCQVSFTTNGSFLTREVAQEIIQLGVDRIGVSLAGVSKGIHEGIRVGSSLDKILENIRVLQRLKEEKKSQKPEVIISFLVMKTNQKELQNLPALAQRCGVQEVVITNLDYVTTPYQDSERVFSCKDYVDETRAIYHLAAKKARDLGVLWRSYPLTLEEVLICELNPLNMLYISSKGEVSPCVYLCSLGSSTIHRIFSGQKIEVAPLILGDLTCEDLLSIWKKERYMDFRRIFEKRWRMFRQLEGESFEEKNIYRFLNRYQELLLEYPLPRSCQTCYKAYGI